MEKKLFLLTGFLCLYLTGLCFTPPYLLQPENQVENISQNQTFSWITNNELLRYDLKVYECDYEKGSNSNSINLNEYEYLRDQHISNGRKTSGLTWAEGYTYPLLTCADEYQQLHAFDKNSLRSTVFNRLFGFYEVNSYGGITHLHNHNHIMVDEGTGKIIYIPFRPVSYSNITYPLIPKYDVNIDISNVNEGIEGIAYNQFTNSVYLAKEKSPMRLYEFKAALAPDFATAPGNLTQPFDLEKAAKTWNIKNVSGLFHLSKSPALNGTTASNNLLVLSSESKVLIECDLNGKEISRLNLNVNGANGTLPNGIEKATGIAYSDGIIYILSSPVPEKSIPGKIFAFSNSNYKASNTSIGNLIYSKPNIQGNSHRASNLNYQTNKSYCWNVVGTNSVGSKFKSNYFSFGKALPPEPEIEKQITLKKPSQNSAFKPGETITIEWDQNIDFKVNVYFYNGASIVRTPAINFDGRRVQFTIPSNSLTGSNYSIRVAVADDESVYDDNKIRVDANQITIIRPTPNFTFEPNDIMSVEWVQNVDFRVNIDFYNGSSRLQNIATNYSGRKFNFKIPANSINGSNYSIRISSTSNTANYFDRKFSIQQVLLPQGPMITISSPSVGQRYFPSDILPIRWNFSSTHSVKITLKSYDNTTVYTLKEAYPNLGYLDIKAPFFAEKSDRYYIEISSAFDNTILSRTSEFTIAAYPGISNVQLSKGYLNNTTKYMPGDYITVTWDDNITGNVLIQLYTESGWVSAFVGSTESDGKEVVRLYPKLPISDDIVYRVRVMREGDKSIQALSDPFRITTHTIFSFLTPVSASYNSNGIMKVSWRDYINGLDGLNVNLFLMNGDETIKKIVSEGPNNKLFYWVIGSDIKDGNKYRLRLELAVQKGLIGISPYFSISDGQAKLTQQMDFSIAPNPATDFVNISFDNTADKTIDLKLYNSNGACLKNVMVDEENLRLDVSALPPGYYFINIRDEKNIINKKILIE